MIMDITNDVDRSARSAGLVVIQALVLRGEDIGSLTGRSLVGTH